MASALFILLTLFVVGLFSAYCYVNHIYSYWKRKYIPYIKPIFPFGNFKKNIFQQISFGQLTEELYKSSDEPVLGFYATLKPSLLIRDPELIRNILIKDFSSFYHRGLYSNEKVDPLTGNLLFLNGEKWRNLRTKLSPAFTSGKLKAMFSGLIDCGQSLQMHVGQMADKKQSIEVRDIFARYSTNVIASVAFGIDIDCIREPNCDFREYGKKIFEMSFSNGIRNALSFLSPSLLELLNVRITDKSIQDFMTAVVHENLKLREANNIVRRDFFQLLIQLRNTGNISQNDDEWKTNNDADNKNGKCLSLDEMTAQSFIFFAAGFETSSTAMSFCLYELSRLPDIQRKVYDEIVSVLSKYGGKLTYEAMNEMKYLECCIDETLRRRPPLAMLPRQCTKDYHIKNPDLIIEKDTPILISIVALHHDPKYWNDPYKFDPERFSESNQKTFAERPYLPFGDGPRNCIGMRMGKMQVKVGLVLMLQKFKFELDDEHVGNELKYSSSSIITAPTTGIHLKVSHW